ncbi:hypothetical protein [Enterococcus casseliflavus]|uniref:hypothetical protein n=1 Tax=Enterococcus casseliflavus TaxID=37734 RepID=UPI0011A3569B|nr:hypothetical protein [Enterococcus casseliflavus]
MEKSIGQVVYMDKESENLLGILKIFNIVFLVLNIIGTLAIANYASEATGQAKYISEQLYGTGEDTYFDYLSDEEPAAPVGPQKDYLTFAVVLIVGVGYSVLVFYAIKLLLKHFANVAEMKQMQKIAFKKDYVEK